MSDPSGEKFSFLSEHCYESSIVSKDSNNNKNSDINVIDNRDSSSCLSPDLIAPESAAVVIPSFSETLVDKEKANEQTKTRNHNHKVTFDNKKDVNDNDKKKRYTNTIPSFVKIVSSGSDSHDWQLRNTNNNNNMEISNKDPASTFSPALVVPEAAAAAAVSSFSEAPGDDETIETTKAKSNKIKLTFDEKDVDNNDDKNNYYTKTNNTRNAYPSFVKVLSSPNGARVSNKNKSNSKSNSHQHSNKKLDNDGNHQSNNLFSGSLLWNEVGASSTTMDIIVFDERDKDEKRISLEHKIKNQIQEVKLKKQDPPSSLSHKYNAKSNSNDTQTNFGDENSNRMTTSAVANPTTTGTPTSRVTFRSIIADDDDDDDAKGRHWRNTTITAADYSSKVHDNYNNYYGNSDSNGSKKAIPRSGIVLIERDVVFHDNHDNNNSSTTSTPTSDRTTTFIPTELPETSRLTIAGQDSTLPLAADNERFFALGTADFSTSGADDDDDNVVNNDTHVKIVSCQAVDDDDERGGGGGGYRTILMSAFHRMNDMKQNQSEYWCEGNNEVSIPTSSTVIWKRLLIVLINTIRYLWRAVIQVIIYCTNDKINRLYISRDSGHSIQEHLAWVNCYESYVLGGVIKEFDLHEDNADSIVATESFTASSSNSTAASSKTEKTRKARSQTTGTKTNSKRNAKKNNYFHLNLSFKNRNTSRILAQQIFHFHRWAFLYHLCTGMIHCRLFGFLSQFFNLFAFPPTEHDSLLHKYDTWYYGKGIRLYHCILYWIKTTIVIQRFLLCNLIDNYYDKDYLSRASMNLAAEVHGVESYNMEYSGGPTYGRDRTTKFRQEHRLNIDESIVRSFMTNSIGTMIHNGVEHVLLCLCKHWKNMLYQENGNFAHQRFEQLYPFDVLRVHIPQVLCTLSGSRGRNYWDCTTLGPFVQKLQNFNPGHVVRQTVSDDSQVKSSYAPTPPNNNNTDKDVEAGAGISSFPSQKQNHHDIEIDSEIWVPCQAGQRLVKEIKEAIVPNVCGSIPSRMIPFLEWLDAIHDSFDVLAKEAIQLRDFVATVDLGIKLGYEVLRVVNWKVPSDKFMTMSILCCVWDKDVSTMMMMSPTFRKYRDTVNDTTTVIPRDLIISALGKLASKDERTLRELIQRNLVTGNPRTDIQAGSLLLERVKTLLEREIRRKAIEDRIKELSRGPSITTVSMLVRNEWYWVKKNSNNSKEEWMVLSYIRERTSSTIASATTSSSTTRTNTTFSVENDNDRQQQRRRFEFRDTVTGNQYMYQLVLSGCESSLPSASSPPTAAAITYSSSNDVIDLSHYEIKKYIPVGEAISRAQKVFMTIELDYCKRFSYNTFMEFGSTSDDKSLRNRLRRLATLSQVHCSELDKARLNVLSETKNSVVKKRKRLLSLRNRTNASTLFEHTSGKEIESPSILSTLLLDDVRPQNTLILGGGPIGLFAALHCLHNVILTGGEVKVYEARDAFDQEASSFERAQIVRLDPRLVAMLRYHLGTGFEDVYTPARGEVTAHLGNSLPGQGFVEVTIKRLESMLLDEVINLRSKGLLHYYSDSEIKYNDDYCTFEKKGRALKTGDLVSDEMGSGGNFTVCDFIYESTVRREELKVGEDYDIVHPREKRVRGYRLVDADFEWCQFSAHEPGIGDITGPFENLPPVYKKGCGRIEPTGIMVEKEDSVQCHLDYDTVKDKSFRLDVSNSHVILASGKPRDSKSHFPFTTSEPYAILCIEGIKVSKGMHNFGVQRFGAGLIDDYRTLFTSNTRIVGDFMKSVRISSIIRLMQSKLKDDIVWKFHFDQVAGSLNDKIPAIHSQLLMEMSSLACTKFKRTRLQTRFFELGNNYYLGMELPREFDTWKVGAVSKIAPHKCSMTPEALQNVRNEVQRVLLNHIDRLWYDATLEVLREADVYEFQGKRMIPTFYTIDSPFEQLLGDLHEMDSFRMFRRTYRVFMHEGNGCTQILHLHENAEFHIPTKSYVIDLSTNSKRTLGELDRDDLFVPIDTFEVVSKHYSFSIVRTSGGYISKMPHDVRVGRLSDLSRAPDGYTESKVALATFPVIHFVNHRTLRINRAHSTKGEHGFITAHIGDAQASPHFMRYSGLTGGGINCMSFNNLVGQTLRNVPFYDRIQRYAFETKWSSGEVVFRGTGSCYGQDGFLRPGFRYKRLVDFLFDNVIEILETEAHEDAARILSRDWKGRIAAGIVPRGLENDILFCNALMAQFEAAIQEKFQEKAKFLAGPVKLSPDLWTIISEEKEKLVDTTISKEEALNFALSWSSFLGPCSNDDCYRSKIRAVSSALRLVTIVLKEIIDYSIQLRVENRRKSSELYNQPKSIDTIVDHYATDFQTMSNGLTRALAFAAANFSIYRPGDLVLVVISGFFCIWTFHASYEVFFKAIRYNRKNLSYVRDFIQNRLGNVCKHLFSLMTKDQRDRRMIQDPFESSLKLAVDKFVHDAEYYGSDKSSIAVFQRAYDHFNGSDKSERRILQFMRQLIVNFIADMFHENSYLQEDLVDIYKELLEMRCICNKNASSGVTGADQLFSSLLQLEPELRRCFMLPSQRKGGNSSMPSYFFSRFIRQRMIAREAKEIKQNAEKVLAFPGSNYALRRSVRDLTEFWQASYELEVTLVLIVATLGAMVSSFSVAILRIVEVIILSRSNQNYSTGWLEITNNVLLWTGLLLVIGAVIALSCLTNRLRHISHIGHSIARFQMKASGMPQLRSITSIQLIVSILHLATLLTSCIAILYLLVTSTARRIDLTSTEYLPLFLSTTAVISVLFAAKLSTIVEFSFRHNLDPCLGLLICKLFDPVIHQLYRDFAKPITRLEIETPQDLETETWNYVARAFLHEYRFDVILDVNRFDSIFQMLQSHSLKQESPPGSQEM